VIRFFVLQTWKAPMLGAADRAASDSLSLQAPSLPKRGCGRPMQPPLPHLRLHSGRYRTLNGCRGLLACCAQHSGKWCVSGMPDVAPCCGQCYRVRLNDRITYEVTAVTVGCLATRCNGPVRHQPVGCATEGLQMQLDLAERIDCCCTMILQQIKVRCGFERVTDARQNA
jgi:hypothetical protein